MPLQATSGAASYDAFGGGVAAVPNYIEDVFSTYLYTGNGSTQTINNGVNLSTYGGLVWSKSRSNIENNVLLDTIRGPNNILVSNSTAAGSTSGTPYVTATTTGYSIGTANNQINVSGQTYASWTFRKQPKFFDVVTYTGDGVAGRQIAHNLGSAPGCIIIKNYSGTDAGLRGWGVWHRTLAEDYHLTLNSTAAQTLNTSYPLFGKPAQQTSTYFTVGQSDATGVNATTNGTGLLYVAYLFAHDAGGFGLTGTDNVISCGSYTGTGATQNISLGYEPQWIMIKPVNLDGPNWLMFDTMRGWNNSTDDFYLAANSAAAEANYRTSISGDDLGEPTATGFKLISTSGAVNASGEQYIYIAIRRGPMKVPTSGTSVFAPVARAGTSTATTVTTGFPVDFIMSKGRNPSVGLGENWGEFDRLRGLAVLSSNKTGTEFTSPTYQLGIADFANNTGMNLSASDNDYGYINKSGYNYGTYFLRRAPSFFDEVCYTGDGTGVRNITHNLSAVPEMMIVKSRSTAVGWQVYHSALGNTKYLQLNNTGASATGTDRWNDTTPTASVFTISSGATVNTSGATYVAYLFATCAGVSKVGSYTGNGSSQTINCGFTSGARFVLIKSTSAAGHWRVYDTARGIVAGNEPELFLNLTNAEQTVYDAIDTDSSGFIVNSNGANVNDSGVTYIFLAIA